MFYYKYGVPRYANPARLQAILERHSIKRLGAEDLGQVETETSLSRHAEGVPHSWGNNCVYGVWL